MRGEIIEINGVLWSVGRLEDDIMILIKPYLVENTDTESGLKRWVKASMRSQTEICEYIKHSKSSFNQWLSGNRTLPFEKQVLLRKFIKEKGI